jgi:hypothetical protein
MSAIDPESVAPSHPAGPLGPRDLRDALLALSLIPPVLLLRYGSDVLTASGNMAADVVNVSPLREPVLQLVERWKDMRAGAEGATGAALGHVFVWVWDHLDPTSMVLDRVDIDQIIAERVDIDRIIERIDLVALVTEVVAELDLPEIVRDSSQTMAAETVDGLRVRGMNADRSLAEFIDRVLRRRSGRGPVGLDPSSGTGTAT